VLLLEARERVGCDRGEKNSFLLVKAAPAVDPPVLPARWMHAAGQVLHQIGLSAEDLAP